ncbi:MAG: hypothetical protein II700_05145, partial [Firmicutes bacterium]|nr:hypothetical protein [Bacillota bacterium]
MSELRDKTFQKNRLLFRHNITRIGEMMAYELSKTREYKPKTVTKICLNSSSMDAASHRTGAWRRHCGGSCL